MCGESDGVVRRGDLMTNIEVDSLSVIVFD